MLEPINLSEETDSNQALNSDVNSGIIPNDNTSHITRSPEEHKAAILRYKSGEAYTINAKLREDVTLTEDEQEFADTLNEALTQLPIYEGTVYRNITFDDFGGEEAYNAFLEQHSQNKLVYYNQFTSCSTQKDGYPVDGKFRAHLIINGANARNVDGYGNNMENEVIFVSGSAFFVDKVDVSTEYPIIYLQEVALNESETSLERSNAMRNMQKLHTENDNVQGISERNTEGNTFGQVRPQFASPSGQWDTLRSGGRQETLLSPESQEQINSQTDAESGESENGGIASFGGIDTVKGKHLNKAQQDEIRSIGEKLGRTVIYEDFYKLDKFEGKKKIPDGYIDKDGNIHINFYAKRPVYFIFKHEITHYLKRALPAYTDFMDMVFKSKAFSIWLHKKGYSSIKELKAEIMDTYSEVKGFDETKCYDEILADFVGERLFGGKNAISLELINALEPKPRRKFLEVIKDFITYLKSKFSKEAKISTEIARIEKEFIKVYNEAVKTDTNQNSDNDGEQYSIVNLDSGKSYVQASRNVIKGNSVAEWRKQISNFFSNSLKNGPIEIKTVEGDTLTITKETAEKARDINVTENGVTRRLTDNEFLVKLHAESHIDELAEISVAQKSSKGKKNVAVDTKNHDFARDGFTYRTVYFQDFDGGYYRISLSIGEDSGISTVYNVGKIKADDIPNGNIVSAIGSKADMSSTNKRLAQKPPIVKNNISDKGEDYSIPTQMSAESLLESYESGETHLGEALRDTPKSLMPKSNREWSVFDRSFANQTNSLKNGETKSIIIHTAEAQYLVVADGYMSGIIISKADINDYNERIEYFGNIRRTDVFDFRNEKQGDKQGDSSNRDNSFKRKGTDSFDVELDKFIREHSEQLRNIRQTRANITKNELEEESYSIPVNISAENLLESYENGEITRQEYLDMVKREKTLNPVEIANLTEEDARTTPQTSVESYSEMQYNSFGWVRYNDVLTAAEYSTLLSRYADYKHNKDNYPTTRFGEAVIFSFDYPDVIMYVKGTIRNPQITKVLKMKRSLSIEMQSEIREEILHNERRHLSFPYETIIDFYGEEVFTICKARDYASFRQYTAEQKGRNSKESDNVGGKQQDGARSDRTSETADRFQNNGIKNSNTGDGSVCFFIVPKNPPYIAVRQIF